MRIVMTLVAIFAFLVLLGASVLSGFDIVPLSTGIGIAISSFLLGAVAVGLIFYQFGEGSED